MQEHLDCYIRQRHRADSRLRRSPCRSSGTAAGPKRCPLRGLSRSGSGYRTGTCRSDCLQRGGLSPDSKSHRESTTALYQQDSECLCARANVCECAPLSKAAPGPSPSPYHVALSLAKTWPSSVPASAAPPPRRSRLGLGIQHPSRDTKQHRPLADKGCFAIAFSAPSRPSVLY